VGKRGGAVVAKAKREASKPKMAVIRQVRPAEALFYNAFKRMDVRFIYATQNPIPYPIAARNLELVNLKFKPKWLFDPVSLLNKGNYNSRSWVEIEGLEEKLKDVDVVNISSIFYAWSGQEARLAKKLGKKLVTIVWENIPYHISTFIPPYSLSVKEVVKSTDLFILRSKRAQRFTDSLGIPKSKVKVIYKGIDLSIFHPSTKPRLKLEKKEINICYVGQLVASKGVSDLLSVFIKLSKEFKNVKLTIAGAGPLEKIIKKHSRDYPISYCGTVEYKDLPALYRKADIFCMPSRDHKYLGLIKGYEEMFGYVLVEAQASGLPVVTTFCGAIPEVVGKENPFVDQGDRERLYQALKRLIEDKLLRYKLGRSNRKRAEKLFSLEKQAEKTEEAILSLL
jgi:glycosyltransferase involved in cell wall biosynthesis